MSRIAELPSSRRHIIIFDEDWELLESLYGPRGAKPIGISVAIRAILHQKCKAIRQTMADRKDLEREGTEAAV